jgi:FtsP/CotA-like multicopper oxidase with cupredoxin domain/plastocyanin
MAVIRYWIQLENHPWDVCPNNIDRMTGLDLKHREGNDPATVKLTSPGTGVVRSGVTMFRPLRAQQGGQTVVDDALILRRYKPPTKQDLSDAWTVPDDRKVNPWDLNEPDPTDSGTMGTIPGPVVECSVGDSVIVNFRNMDNRTQPGTEVICFPFPLIGQICIPFPVQVPFPIEKRTHSLHPHGFVFAPTSDGAYPLSPPDPGQSIPASELAAWASVGVTGPFKQGDRVPPGGTFTYTWNTLGWPTTAGVWLYHDHSVCDMDNVEHGAIGIIVIHNPKDTANEVDIRIPNDPNNTPDPAFLPQGTLNASPIETICFPLPFPFESRVLPHDLAGLGLPAEQSAGASMRAMAMGGKSKTLEIRKGKHATETEPGIGPPVSARTIEQKNVLLELDDKLDRVIRICFRFYAQPASKALYLQLFHTLGDAGMCMNGRKYLGNTPTMIARPRVGNEAGTKMRFGVVGMGSDFHTFHIHGHRWIIPGPTGTNLNTIQNSVQNSPVSQFEDTRAFGPANSFVFTIDEDSGLPSFFRAEPSTAEEAPPAAQPALGEWHMHCHVLDHMMQGMMGSLLVVTGGTFANPLPSANLVCPDDVAGMGGMGGGGGPSTAEVDAIVDNTNPTGFSFSPSNQTVSKGDTVIFKNLSATGAQPHSIVWDTPGSPPNSPVFNPGSSTSAVISTSGTFKYHCGVHGPQMNGTIIVN